MRQLMDNVALSLIMTFTVMTHENAETEMETNAPFQIQPADEAYERPANIHTLLGSTC